jgi:CRISPR-associated protein Cas8a1/Csx13
MGKVGWNKQQQTRTGILSLETVDEAMLDQFETAVRCLKNRTVIKKPVPAKKGPAPKKGFFVSTSLVRGLAAENIAKGNDWFCGFRRLMKSRESARLIAFEREGVAQMVQEAQWSDQADIVLVQAVHAAVRNRYGALAARAKRRGERIRFDKEFERMRMGLMRAKNASTLRAELADLFARGGVNKTLQAEWQTIMPLFTGPDWQRTRDLALLALASYAGKGSKEIEEAEIGLEETEE